MQREALVIAREKLSSDKKTLYMQPKILMTKRQIRKEMTYRYDYVGGFFFFAHQVVDSCKRQREP